MARQECDVAVDRWRCAPERARLRDASRRRADLLAEHLGRTPDEVHAAIAEHGLAHAIDKLRGPGRTLSPYEPDPINPAEEILAENDLLDPERPPKWLLRAKATLLAPLR